MREIKKDKWFRDRQSTYVILGIRCSRCGEEVLLYQKDGRGNLKRLYLNRILAPENIASLQDRVESVKGLILLKCKCGSDICIPMLHREGRLAFRLIPGSFTKHKERR